MGGTGVATLATPRLLLRPLALAVLDRLTTIWTHSAVVRFLLTRPSSRAEVEERLHAILEHARLFWMWALELRATGELIGRCGFYPYAGEGDLVEPELAFLLAREHWGAGLASEKVGMREERRVAVNGMEVTLYAVAAERHER